jgi:hypothetical protein
MEENTLEIKITGDDTGAGDSPASGVNSPIYDVDEGKKPASEVPRYQKQFEELLARSSAGLLNFSETIEHVETMLRSYRDEIISHLSNSSISGQPTTQTTTQQTGQAPASQSPPPSPPPTQNIQKSTITPQPPQHPRTHNKPTPSDPRTRHTNNQTSPQTILTTPARTSPRPSARSQCRPNPVHRSPTPQR